MQAFVYLRPQSLGEALAFAQQHGEARPLAGGQSLLAAMKLGLNDPSHLIDLQDIPDLQDIRVEGESLRVGAMVTHSQIARSSAVQAFCPMLAAMAAGIADEQVRAVGTIGGSLANNDPAACWPAGVLALNATLVTDRRSIAADLFFQGLYTTALQPGELLLAVHFPRPLCAAYHKQEQPASRFALVGVAIARMATPSGASVRVALTGLGQGVWRWTAAEAALSARWSAAAFGTLELAESQALGDVHASAAYRAHLAGVWSRRLVARLTGEPQARSPRRPRADPSVAGTPVEPAVAGPGTLLAGSHLLALPLARVWEGILDPEILRRCIPGCEGLQALGPHAYAATVKIGLGPVSARFTTQISLSDLQVPVPAMTAACKLHFEGHAGGLGHGQGTARVRLSQAGPQTRLDWQARTQVSGRIAQLGNRLIEATARKLSEEFFTRLATALEPAEPSTATGQAPTLPLLSPLQRLFARLEHFLHALFRR